MHTREIAGISIGPAGFKDVVKWRCSSCTVKPPGDLGEQQESVAVIAGVSGPSEQNVI